MREPCLCGATPNNWPAHETAGLIGYWFGPRIRLAPRIISDPRLVHTEQFRFPRSKKRRIREKWARRPFNSKLSPDQGYYIAKLDGVETWIFHPSMFEQVHSIMVEKGFIDVSHIQMA